MIFGGLSIAGVIKRRVGWTITVIGMMIFTYGFLIALGGWRSPSNVLLTALAVALTAIISAVLGITIFSSITRGKERARRARDAARAARGVIQEGRWVWGPRTAKGQGHVHFDFAPHLQALDRATAEYSGEDRDKLRNFYEKIKEATRLPDQVIWPELEVLLNKLEAWVNSVEPRHPLD